MDDQVLHRIRVRSWLGDEEVVVTPTRVEHRRSKVGEERRTTLLLHSVEMVRCERRPLLWGYALAAGLVLAAAVRLATLLVEPTSVALVRGLLLVGLLLAAAALALLASTQAVLTVQGHSGRSPIRFRCGFFGSASAMSAGEHVAEAARRATAGPATAPYASIPPK